MPIEENDAETLADAIAHWARCQGERPALLGDGQAITWGQVHAAVQAIGAQLARLNLGPSHRVGLLVPEGPPGALLILGLACHSLLVPINPALTPAELARSGTDNGLDALVVPEALSRQIGSAMAGVLTLEASVPAGGGTPVLRPIGTQGEPLARPARPAPPGAMLLLRSSGTTGQPKLVPVTHRNMLAMAAKMASPAWFGLGRDDRSAAILPLHYAAGIKVLLLVPLILGGSVAFPPPGRGFHVAEWLARLRPTYFSTSPATLRAIVERLRPAPVDMQGSSLRFVMCGASYLPDDLRRLAGEALQAPIVEYYGLSEAGIMASNPLDPWQARAGSVGRALAADLLVVDEQLQPLPRGETGEIAVHGPSVTPGYLQPDGSVAGVDGGWLRTGDIGRIDADGFLHLAGRAKEVINRGGEKVFPYEVEKALLEHEDVAEAAVYAVPHPRLGQGVAAAVVLRPGSRASPRDIGAWLAGRLAMYKIPRRLRILPSLPRGSTGKVLRGALADLQQDEAALSGQPENLLEIELLEIWRQMLGTPDVGIDDDFLDRGGDSLLATDLLLEVERLTGASTDGWDLSTLSVRAIADQVLRTLPEEPATQRRLLQQVKGGPGAPLFFCHGDRAARGIYAHRLAEAMPASNPLWLLDCPDHDDRASIEEVAQSYFDGVIAAAAAAPGAPVCVAGYCRAGLVAWHLTHLLRTRGVPVQSLVLVDTPSFNGSGVLRGTALAVRTLGEYVPGRAGRFLRDKLMRGMWALRRKGPGRFGAALVRRTRAGLLAGDPRRWSPGEARRRETDEMAVQYYEQIARYVPPRLDVPVTCIVAEEGSPADTDVRRWRRLAPDVRRVATPGTHYTAVLAHRKTLAARLAECLRLLPPHRHQEV